MTAARGDPDPGARERQSGDEPAEDHQRPAHGRRDRQRAQAGQRVQRELAREQQGPERQKGGGDGVYFIL